MGVCDNEEKAGGADDGAAGAAGGVVVRKAKAEASTSLAYTGLRGGLEHLKIETRLRGERFENVKGECVIYKL